VVISAVNKPNEVIHYDSAVGFKFNYTLAFTVVLCVLRMVIVTRICRSVYAGLFIIPWHISQNRYS
jgi:hypothetical protein